MTMARMWIRPMPNAGTLALLGLLLVSCGDATRVSARTELELVQVVFEGLVGNRFETIAGVSPGMKHFQQMVDYVTAVDPDEGKLAAADLTADFQKEQAEEIRKHFQDVRLESGKVLNWQEATLHTELGVRELDDPFKMNRRDIFFTVVDGEKSFVFELDGCFLVGESWICFDGVRFHGPSR